ncbi:MAK10-like protein [Tanacetum coccineum]
MHTVRGDGVTNLKRRCQDFQDDGIRDLAMASERLVSNFMASQDARVSKFETDFKQQQGEMTNKIDIVLKAITDRIMGALPSNTVNNLKLNVNSTASFLSARSCPMEDPYLELGKNGYAFVQGKMPTKIEDHVLFTLPYRLGDSKLFNTLADLRSRVNIIPLYLFKKLKIRLLEETGHVFGLANGTKSYLVGIIRDVEVHIGRLKLLNDFYVIDMKKDPKTPLLLGRGFLATANAVIDYRKAKIAMKEFMECDLLGEWEIARDAKINPFKTVLSITKKRAWHAKIRLIDPDAEEFTKTLQLVPTSRKLSKRESPREIIDLDHFYET